MESGISSDRLSLISTGFPQLDSILGSGYPKKSAILITGEIGTGKEGLCFRFLEAGKGQDKRIVLTHRGASEVVGDLQAYGCSEEGIIWIDRDGSNSAKISVNIREIADASAYLKKITVEEVAVKRIYTDLLSPLLLLNDVQKIYLFLHDLIVHTKKSNGVLIATIEEGMHTPREIATLEQLFDGVLEFKMLQEKLSILTLFRVKKMRGVPVPPRANYFRLTLQKQRMSVESINI